MELITSGETPAEPGFAYTIGLFHNYKQPELIVIGLRGELMHSMLNTLGERMKAGATFAAGDRVAEVLDGFQVLLRPVLELKSFKDYVGYARWFYEGKPFPLLQVVYPDMEGRFPEDAGASEAFRRQQPLPP